MCAQMVHNHDSPPRKTSDVAFIDYSAVFDTGSQLFLDEAQFADVGVPSKVRRIVPAIFTAATGMVPMPYQTVQRKYVWQCQSHST